MKRAFLLGVTTIAMTAAMGIIAFAGTWKSDAAGWWYDNGDGTYPASQWTWIDSNNDGVAESYYFDQSGYCLMNTTTPDGYAVNADGAWIKDGVVQTKNVGSAGNDQNQNVSVDMSTPKAKLEDMNYERSTYGGLYSFDYERAGEQWKGSLCLNAGNGRVYGRYDYYLGGQYNTLTFKAVPHTGNWIKGDVDELYVYDQETGRVLYHKGNITEDTNKFEATVDVSGVQYLRIEAVNNDWYGYILVKDCYLY